MAGAGGRVAAHGFRVSYADDKSVRELGGAEVASLCEYAPSDSTALF